VVDISNGLPKVGFVVDSLLSSQLSYALVYNLNEWLDKHYEWSLAIFYQEQWLPSLWPACSQYHVADTVAFDGTLIATSLSTAFSIKNATRAKRFFYIQDLYNRRPNFNIKQWESIMNNRSIKKFARSDDHRNELEKEGYEIGLDVVPSFEIEKILEITNAN